MLDPTLRQIKACTLLLLLAASIAAAQDATPPAQPGPPTLTHSDVIVVTGTFEPAPLSESDRSVTSLPVREQSLLFGSMVDFLRVDPSLDLRQRGPWGIQGDLSIRGATFGQSLVLLDGLRINDAQSAHHNLDIPLPLESISRIEVLRGAGSTFYGADAMGGAVNFITGPPEASELRLRTGIGNFGFNQQHILASLLRGRWSQTFSADRDFSTGFRPDRDFRSSSASSQTRLESSWGDHGYSSGRKRPSFWRRPVLWQLQFLGTHQGLVRLARAATGKEDARCGRLPAAHR